MTEPPALPPGPSVDEMTAFIAARDAHTVHGALGIRLVKGAKDEVVVAVDVSEKLFQHGGVVHGGIYALLMESCASMLTAYNVDVTKFRVAGQELSCSHVRSASTGVLTARARVVHAGKSAWILQCDVDNDGKLVSTGRCTLAIRPL
jgi:1,4-dihydroxy-2-naphthoyl-CoA hydrolase